MDGDGVDDVSIFTKYKSSVWVENEGDNIPWEISLELLNPNFSIREITGSDAYYSRIDYHVEEDPEGTFTEYYEIYSGCEPIDSGNILTRSSYIMAGSSESKFEEDANGNWSKDLDSNGFIIAESPSELLSYTEYDGFEAIAVSKTYTVSRRCHTIDQSKPVYVQFKTADEDYKVGWIELSVGPDSYTINRWAISKKIIR